MSGATSSRPRTESSVRAVANASNAPEPAKMTINNAPSVTCPIDGRVAPRDHHQQIHVQRLAPQRQQPRQAGLPHPPAT